jgi:hypothetical protein
LLLSLRTPSASFEENKSSANGPPPSPEEPPKIQHAHQQRGDQPLMFEVSALYLRVVLLENIPSPHITRV